MTQIETTRLRLRQWQVDDLERYVGLFADPVVVRYISDSRPLPRQRVEAYSAGFLAQWRERGFGPFAAIEKASEQWIGQIGLNRLTEVHDIHNIELGFELLPAYWGRGLATEGARASLRFGFENHGLHRIISVTNPANVASRRVLEKIGFTYQGARLYHGLESAWYAIDRSTWEAQSAARSFE